MGDEKRFSVVRPASLAELPGEPSSDGGSKPGMIKFCRLSRPKNGRKFLQDVRSIFRRGFLGIPSTFLFCTYSFCFCFLVLDLRHLPYEDLLSSVDSLSLFLPRAEQVWLPSSCPEDKATTALFMQLRGRIKSRLKERNREKKEGESNNRLLLRMLLAEEEDEEDVLFDKYVLAKSYHFAQAQMYFCLVLKPMLLL